MIGEITLHVIIAGIIAAAIVLEALDRNDNKHHE